MTTRRDQCRACFRCRDLVVAVALGTVVTVTSIGVFTLLGPYGDSTRRRAAARQGTLMWAMERWDRPWSTAVVSVRDRYDGGDDDPAVVAALLPDWCRDTLADDRLFRTGAGAPELRVVEAYGWPMAAAWCEPSNRAAPGGLALARTRSWSTGATRVPVTFPVRPIWSGLAIDVGVASGATWLLVVALRAGRARRRVRRGRCASCGYDRRHDAGAACPECGSTVRPTRSSTPA